MQLVNLLMYPVYDVLAEFMVLNARRKLEEVEWFKLLKCETDQPNYIPHLSLHNRHKDHINPYLFHLRATPEAAAYRNPRNLEPQSTPRESLTLFAADPIRSELKADLDRYYLQEYDVAQLLSCNMVRSEMSAG
ncbi:hypothetical protein SPFM12_00270 [Salmonella phage SPFM12]|nr:hypothetical protein SPFM12_00270 [Salmonella phage SPFM12]